MTDELKDKQPLTVVEMCLLRALQASDYPTAVGELRAATDGLEREQQSLRQRLELMLWADYSVIATRFGDYPTALDYRQRLTLRQPDDPYGYLILARLYDTLGNREKAAESLRRCGELADPNDQKLLAVLATKGQLPEDQDVRAHRLADAVACYREALDDRSLENSSARYAGTQQALGSLYRAQADLVENAASIAKLDQAAVAYREALKVFTAKAYPEENRTLLESLKEIEETRKQR
jgi:tetratricopeptide (TPR) repeat protein